MTQYPHQRGFSRRCRAEVTIQGRGSLGRRVVETVSCILDAAHVDEAETLGQHLGNVDEIRPSRRLTLFWVTSPTGAASITSCEVPVTVVTRPVG